MSFDSAYNDRAPSRYPSHFMSSLGPQQPLSLNHLDILRPNLGDTHSDDPRRSGMLPNPDPLLVSDSRLSRDPAQNVDPSYSHHLFFTPGSQPPDLGRLGATPYHEDLLPHAGSNAIGATAVRRLAYPHPRTHFAHHTMPSAGPSRFEGEQPALLWRHDSTAPLGLGMAAPAPAPAPALPPSTSLPRPPFNTGPGVPHPFFSPPSAPSQALNISNVDVIGWPHVAEGDRTPMHVPPAHPRRSRRRLRRFRPVPLVRVEDDLEWPRPDVLKMTLWLNWSPNADAEAHLPWDREPPRAAPQ